MSYTEGMILAQIANTSYNSVNLNRLLPEERELLKVEHFDSVEDLVKECNPRERYVVIKNNTQLNPGDIEKLWNEVFTCPYCVALRADYNLRSEEHTSELQSL